MALFDRARIFFANCTDPGATCEAALPQEIAVGGVNGVCDVASGLCVCPGGFDGADLLGLWNDCHVPQGRLHGLFVGLVVTSSIVGAVCILTLLKMVRAWGLIEFSFGEPKFRTMEEFPDSATAGTNVSAPGSSTATSAAPRIVALPDEALGGGGGDNSPPTGDSDKNSPDSQPARKSIPRRDSNKDSDPSAPRRSSILSFNLTSLQQPKTNAPSKAYNLQVTMARRRRTNLAVVLCLLVYSCASLAYAVITLASSVRFEQTWWLQLLLLSISISFIITSLCAVVYAWYSNLPSIVIFAQMFPKIRNSIIVRYPLLIKRVLVGISIGTISFSVLVLFVVPMADPWLIDLVLVHIGLSLLGFMVAVFLFCFEAVCHILLNLFAEVTSRPSSRNLAASPALRRPSEGTSLSPSRKPSVSSPGSGTGKIELGDAIFMVRAVSVVALLGAMLVMGLCFTMAFSYFAKRNYYIFVSALIIGGDFVGCFVCGVLVFWMGL